MKKILLFVFSALALFNLSSCFEDDTTATRVIWITSG